LLTRTNNNDDDGDKGMLPWYETVELRSQGTVSKGTSPEDGINRN